jgi:transposase InsO family protein
LVEISDPSESSCSSYSDSSSSSEESNPEGSSDWIEGNEDNEDSYGEEVSSSTCLVAADDVEEESKPRFKEWYVDSGASYHLTEDYSTLIDPEPADLTLTAMGDKTVKAEWVGKASLRYKYKDKWYCLVLPRVYYGRDFDHNLLSTIALAREAGIHTLLTGSDAKLISEGVQVASAPVRGRSYILKTKNYKTPRAMLVDFKKRTLKEWHQDLGHVSKSTILRMERDGLVRGMEVTKKNVHDDEDCIVCPAAKQTRSAQPKESSSPPKEIGSTLHSDGKGPIRPRAKDKSRYEYNIIDNASSWGEVFTLRKKSHIAKVLKEFIPRFEKQFNVKVKTLRCDRGGEYNSKKIRKFCASMGIEIQMTERRTSVSNGKSERFHRTVWNGVRSMLFSSDLPLTFWDEAAKYMAYILKRVSTRSNPGYKSPHEVLTGEKPSISHILRFGSKCTVAMPKGINSSLQKKAEEGFLVGIDEETKAYRVYVPRTKLIVVSKDIQNIRSKKLSQDPVEMSKTIAGTPEVTMNEVYPEEKFDLEDLKDGCAVQDVPPKATQAQDGDQNVRKSKRIAERKARGADSKVRSLIVAALQAYEEEKDLPKDIQEALVSVRRKEWREAAITELKALIKNETWEIVDRPSNINVIKCKWVFDRKWRPGELERFKARLVARGFTQRWGIDFWFTSSPVITSGGFRMLFKIAAQWGRPVQHLDVPTAYLNGELDSDQIYMEVPDGMDMVHDGDLSGKVLRLRKGLYGLKQSGRCWNQLINNFLLDHGFTRCRSEPCIYISKDGDVVIGLYVDDLLVLGQNEGAEGQIVQLLTEGFNTKNLGDAKYCLGIEIERRSVDGAYFLCQEKYVGDILKKFKHQDCKSVGTPMETSDVFFQNCQEKFDQETYRSAIGSLLYLSTCTRPDIAHAVGVASRFVSNPMVNHWNGVKRIFKYLQGTRNYGILMEPSDQDPMQVEVFTDADWAGDKGDRKSTSGLAVFVGGSLVTWLSKKQDSVALSTMEAEYMAASRGVQEILWFRQLLEELKELVDVRIILKCDSSSAINFMENDLLVGRAKHIDIRYHFIKDEIKNKLIRVKYCKTEEMVADILTKATTREIFEKMRMLMGMVMKN